MSAQESEVTVAEVMHSMTMHAKELADNKGLTVARVNEIYLAGAKLCQTLQSGSSGSPQLYLSYSTSMQPDMYPHPGVQRSGIGMGETSMPESKRRRKTPACNSGSVKRKTILTNIQVSVVRYYLARELPIDQIVQELANQKITATEEQIQDIQTGRAYSTKGWLAMKTMPQPPPPSTPLTNFVSSGASVATTARTTADSDK